MNDCDIKIIEAEELEIIVPLFDAYRIFYGQKSDVNAAREYLSNRFLNNEIISFLALDTSSKAIGFSNVYRGFSSVSMMPVWTLNDLYVEPEARRSGVGQQLMTAVEKHAVQNGILRLNLQTAQDNIQAQKCYEKQGWKSNCFITYQLNLNDKYEK